jgi:Zn-dependent protease with chaperone function
MTVMRRALLALAVLVLAGGCAQFPERAYFPGKGAGAAPMAQILYRAARAAGDEPERYSFAFVKSREVSAWSADDATFYFSEGLVRLDPPHVEALVAHEVAHEVLGHAGQRRNLSLGISAGFTVLGVFVPGLGLADVVVNPLIVRAFTRDQELAADRRAIEIIRTMGHPAPRRTLADALRAADAVNGAVPGGILAAAPELRDRLAALEPLEPAEVPARGAGPDSSGPLAKRPKTPAR